MAALPNMLPPKRPIFSTDTITTLLIISGAYVLLPFLYITRYDHPSADDYGFANMFAQHDLGTVWKQQYLEWTGRYLMPVFFRMNPTCAHSLFGYRVAAFITILLFTGVIALVVNSLTRQYLTGRQSLGLSALLVGLYVAKTPSIPEAFFWFAGYSLYQFANIFFLLLLMALAKLHRQMKPDPGLAAWSALLCIIIIGCNEVSMIMTLLLVFYIAGTNYTRYKKLPASLVVLCAICTICATIEIAAPGNYVRLNAQHKSIGSIVWTITGSLSTTVIYGSQWIGPLLAASVLYIPLFGMPIARRIAAAQERFDLSIRSFTWFLLSALAFLQIFILWTANGSSLGRILNVVWLFVIGGYFFLLQLLLNKYLARLELLERFRKGMAALGLGLFFACLLDINNGISTAYIDIFSGKARAYDQELTDRAAQVSAAHSDTCRVPALRDVPATIFFTDIRPLNDSSGLWINLYYSQYWHSGFVVPDAAPPIPTPNLETLRKLGKAARSTLAQ